MFLAPIALVAIPTIADAQPGAIPPPAPVARPAPAPTAPAPNPPPAPGSYAGACYGNQTCNQGLSCEPTSNLCVQAPAARPTPPPAAYPPQGGQPPAPYPGQPAPYPGQPAPYPNGGYAQPAPAPMPPPPLQPTTPVGFENHQGLMVGFGLGLSSLSCENCGHAEGGLGFDFNLGGFINPRLALMYDASGWYDSEDGITLSLTLHALAAQYWVSPKLWIKGAAGVANSRTSFEGFESGSNSESGSGIGGGLGYEFVQSGNLAVDLSARLNIVSINESSATTVNAVVGVRWK
jgi:hypothetical protein